MKHRCPTGATGRKGRKMNKHLYLITVENDVEPTIVGPFENEDARDYFAKDFRENVKFEGGIYPMDIESDMIPKSVTAQAYAGGFFQGDDEFEDEGKESTTRPSSRNLMAFYNLNTAQAKKVEKIMMRTGDGAPALLEMPEGPEDVTACSIYTRDLREIGQITPAEAFKLSGGVYGNDQI
jgi:hypothetical protein